MPTDTLKETFGSIKNLHDRIKDCPYRLTQNPIFLRQYIFLWNELASKLKTVNFNKDTIDIIYKCLSKIETDVNVIKYLELALYCIHNGERYLFYKNDIVYLKDTLSTMEIGIL